MTRIELTDTAFDVVAKLSDGNPGAISVCTQIIKEGGDIDPQAFGGGIFLLLGLDTCKLYGSRIWMLYKDVCGENLSKMLAVLRANQLGFLSAYDLNFAIDNRGSNIDVDDLCQQVVDRLEDFNLIEDPA